MVNHKYAHILLKVFYLFSVSPFLLQLRLLVMKYSYSFPETFTIAQKLNMTLLRTHALKNTFSQFLDILNVIHTLLYTEKLLPPLLNEVCLFLLFSCWFILLFFCLLILSSCEKRDCIYSKSIS